MSRKTKQRLVNRLAQNSRLFTEPFESLEGSVHVVDGQRYHFIDNGGDILIVAHTDSVVEKPAFSVDKNKLACPTLDNRIGVYLALHELPLRGIKADVLLTEGEEMCFSSAQVFETDKKYNWIAEFDRMGFDCALYQYSDKATQEMVAKHGYTPVHGSYTDIVEMDGLGVKGFNFGVGYRDYHSANSHIMIADLVHCIRMFVSFYNEFKNTPMPHTVTNHYYGRNRYKGYYGGGNWSTYTAHAPKTTRGKYSRTASYYSRWDDDDRFNETTWHDASNWRDEDDEVGFGLCEACGETYSLHNLYHDHGTEQVLCEDCYSIMYTLNAPRPKSMIDLFVPCEVCQTIHESVRKRDLFGVTAKVCHDCYSGLLDEELDDDERAAKTAQEGAAN